MFMSYEEIFADFLTSIRKILEFYDLSSRYSDREIEKTLELIDGTKTRKNVGLVGRGRAAMNNHQICKIEELAMSWKVPLEDFNLLGIC